MIQRILLTLILLFLPSYLIRLNLFGYKTNILEILLFGFILISFFKIFKNKKTSSFFSFSSLSRLSNLSRLFRLSLFSLLLYFSTSLLLFHNPPTLNYFKSYLIEPFLFGLILFHLLKSKMIEPVFIYKTLTIGGILTSFFGLFQYFFPIYIPQPWDLEKRITGFFEYPNAQALYLGPLFILVFFQLLKWKSQSIFENLFWFFSSFLFIFNIILAKSEAGLFAIITTLFCAGIFHQKTRIKTIFLTFFFGLFLLINPFSKEYFLEKILFQDFSQQVRISQWSETLSLLKQHWFFGVGMGNYQTAMQPFHKDLQYEIFEYPHQIFLNIWSELGLIPLLFFLFGCFYLLKKMFFFLPLQSSLASQTFPFFAKASNGKPAFFILLQMFFHGLFDVPFFKNDLSVLTSIFITLVLFYLWETSCSHQQKTKQKS